MKEVSLEYCIDGFNMLKEKVVSFNLLKKRLQEIKDLAFPLIKGIFSVDIVIVSIGRISIALDEKCILAYSSDDFKENLTSLGDEFAKGDTMYYFGDYSLMSNKYVVSYSDTLNELEHWIQYRVIGNKIKWKR